MRDRWKTAALIIAATIAVVAVGWAMVLQLGSQTDPGANQTTPTVVVRDGEVESSIALSVSASWRTTSVGQNLAQGVVTSISVTPGTTVNNGTVLYTVNLRPVSIAAGSIPAFRSISEGTEGEDVRQVQTFLKTLGFYQGPADGKAGSRTASGIKAWQKSINVSQTGVIDAGDIIFVPELPLRIDLNSEIVGRGAQLSGGETVVNGIESEPTFLIKATESQAAQILTDTPVSVTGPDGIEWSALAGDQNPAEGGGVDITLKSTGNSSSAICGDRCDTLSIGETTLLPSTVILVPRTEGLVVPTSALSTLPDGTTVVIDGSGEAREVKVGASARGLSIVEGVAAGEQVRVTALQNSKTTDE